MSDTLKQWMLERDWPMAGIGNRIVAANQRAAPWDIPTTQARMMPPWDRRQDLSPNMAAVDPGMPILDYKKVVRALMDAAGVTSVKGDRTK
jgi:hypothetical protein